MNTQQEGAAMNADEATRRDDMLQLHQHLSDLHDHHHGPMAALMLASYAADASRVLSNMERHADMSPAFAAMLASACPDWRNPGSTVLPHDLIATALTQATADLQTIFHHLQRTIEAIRPLQPIMRRKAGRR